MSSKGNTHTKYFLFPQVKLESQYHFYMETQVALAIPDEDNCITIYSLAQFSWTISMPDNGPAVYQAIQYQKMDLQFTKLYNIRKYLQVMHCFLLCVIVTCFAILCSLYLDKQIYFVLGLVQALFSACQNLADEASSLQSEKKEFKLYKQHVDNLHHLAGKFW